MVQCPQPYVCTASLTRNASRFGNYEPTEQALGVLSSAAAHNQLGSSVEIMDNVVCFSAHDSRPLYRSLPGSPHAEYSLGSLSGLQVK